MCVSSLSLILQGPKAPIALQRLLPSSVDLAKIPFLTCSNAPVCGVPCQISRCGYTGEDGFEISVPDHRASEIASALLEQPGTDPSHLVCQMIPVFSIFCSLFSFLVKRSIRVVWARVTHCVWKLECVSMVMSLMRQSLRLKQNCYGLSVCLLSCSLSSFSCFLELPLGVEQSE